MARSCMGIFASPGTGEVGARSASGEGTLAYAFRLTEPLAPTLTLTLSRAARGEGEQVR